MGTRGYIVVKFENRYYRIYNHWDSYPSNLGVKVVSIIREEQLNKNLDCLNNVIEQFKEQVYITDNKNDIENDLFIEWVYIIDLDESTLKITGGYYEPTYTFEEIKEWDSDSDWVELFNKENDK
jgi:hypothetical protein